MRMEFAASPGNIPRPFSLSLSLSLSIQWTFPPVCLPAATCRFTVDRFCWHGTLFDIQRDWKRPGGRWNDPRMRRMTAINAPVSRFQFPFLNWNQSYHRHGRLQASSSRMLSSQVSFRMNNNDNNNHHHGNNCNNDIKMGNKQKPRAGSS